MTWLTPSAKPPPVAVRKTEALPCAGIDLRGTKISPLPLGLPSPEREEKSK
jgi:hypothetical protein